MLKKPLFWIVVVVIVVILWFLLIGRGRYDENASLRGTVQNAIAQTKTKTNQTNQADQNINKWTLAQNTNGVNGDSTNNGGVTPSNGSSNGSGNMNANQRLQRIEQALTILHYQLKRVEGQLHKVFTHVSQSSSGNNSGSNYGNTSSNAAGSGNYGNTTPNAAGSGNYGNPASSSGYSNGSTNSGQKGASGSNNSNNSNYGNYGGASSSGGSNSGSTPSN